MGVILGIDLGTTNSAVAVFRENGVAEVLHNSDGHNTTPSVVQFEDDDVVVGLNAKNSAVLLPNTTVSFAKRYMDKPHELGFNYNGKAYSSIDISAIILKKLKEDAIKASNSEIDGVVITVPAYFDTNAKEATKQAAEIAGLKVLRLVMEPTSAAIYFAHKNKGDLENKSVLVYDLGGGTFDVSMIKINGDKIEVLATAGDPKLGGKDIDSSLVDHIITLIKQDLPNENINFEDLTIKAELWELAEKAKKALSQKNSERLRMKTIPKLKRDLTREEFESVIEHHINTTMNHVHIVVQKAGKPDVILLVGGSTRTPLVSDMLEKEFGVKPLSNVNPDEVVAQGAALLATKVAIEEGMASGADYSDKVLGELQKLQVQDIAPHSIGFQAETYGVLQNNILIPRGAKLPYSQTTQEYGFNGSIVRFVLNSGESSNLDEVDVIGELEINRDPSSSGRTDIFITVTQDADGTIRSTVKTLPSGNVYNLDVKSDNLLSEKEIISKKQELSRKDID